MRRWVKISTVFIVSVEEGGGVTDNVTLTCSNVAIPPKTGKKVDLLSLLPEEVVSAIERGGGAACGSGGVTQEASSALFAVGCGGGGV